MGNSAVKEPPPPPPPPQLVIVPPLFDFPPLAARTRMLDSSYNVLFGKLALKCLFEDYFEAADHFATRIMLKPIDDPHVDLIASISGPLEARNADVKFVGSASFRWQSDLDDPNTFVDLSVSSADPIWQLRSSAYYPEYGFGAFGILPLLLRERISAEDYGVVGLRYGSESLSIGAAVMPFASKDETTKHAWLVSKMGRLTIGVQYEPDHGSKHGLDIKNLMNWSAAIGYGVGSGSPLSPSFTVGLELAKTSQFIASFYQHMVVQRQVQNPFEENVVVGITNYIDFGFELQTSVDDAKKLNGIPDSTFQLAASWQANKNLLLKGKIGPLSSTLALAFKSWWKPAITVNISATTNRKTGNTSCGLGIRFENLREASYERADPNHVMLTPSKEHLAEGISWKIGKRPMLESDLKAGNIERLPKELRPLGKIL